MPPPLLPPLPLLLPLPRQHPLLLLLHPFHDPPIPPPTPPHRRHPSAAGRATAPCAACLCPRSPRWPSTSASQHTWRCTWPMPRCTGNRRGSRGRPHYSRSHLLRPQHPMLLWPRTQTLSTPSHALCAPPLAHAYGAAAPCTCCTWALRWSWTCWTRFRSCPCCSRGCACTCTSSGHMCPRTCMARR